MKAAPGARELFLKLTISFGGDLSGMMRIQGGGEKKNESAQKGSKWFVKG